MHPPVADGKNSWLLLVVPGYKSKVVNITIPSRLAIIKGADNPTSQLLPIMSKKCCSGDGEGRKDKGGGGGKMVCDKVVCVKDGVVKDGV